ncbi:MAG: nucleotidyltransferase domain-containing protein [Planctomycetia bacterium]|nr:nucleotidyltransferase domain-containing protein [Planctomycetia bacterium]
MFFHGSNSISPELLERASDAILAHPKVEAAYLLGSAVDGRLRGDSDIDIAILLRRSAVLSVMDRLLLTASLGRVFGRPVDLGILSTANLVYAKEAIAHGRLIAERDHGVTARFAMHVLSMYAGLQESRREVLRAYSA